MFIDLVETLKISYVENSSKRNRDQHTLSNG